MRLAKNQKHAFGTMWEKKKHRKELYEKRSDDLSDARMQTTKFYELSFILN